MKEINLQSLQLVFNAMCEINTKGNDTVVMGQCLQTMQQIIQDEAAALKEEAVSAEIKPEEE